MRALFLPLFTAYCLSAAAFSEREFKVYNSEAGIELGGTLVEPEGTAKAALVLASGSGQQNRDEEVLGHRPFKRIAEYLGERGYAVLRLDDRGIGASGGEFQGSTNTDFVSDISAAIACVDSIYHGNVPVGVLGHSEGGTTAIKLGAHNPLCRFIITLAAPAWSGDSIIMSQTRAIAVGQTGRWDAEPIQRRILDYANSTLPATIARPLIIQTLAEQVGMEAAKLPQVQEQFAAAANVMLSPWYREFLRYNPENDIKAINIPWLALNGTKDVQVVVANLATIRELNTNAKTVELSNHNHLFQRCTTGLVDEYATLPEDISDETLATIAEWLDTQYK